MIQNPTNSDLSEEKLPDVYNAIRESLKFIEAKHAGLIAINSGLIFGVFSVYKEIGQLFHWSNALLICLLLIATFLSLLSFYPIKKRKKRKDQTVNINLFYSESLYKLSHDSLKDLINHEPNKVMDDMIKWTINTSGVARRKYRLFRKALLFTIIAVVTAVVIIINYALCIFINP